jgi:hypothetical protein
VAKTRVKSDSTSGTNADSQGLKRLGGGRWQSRDERFTIEQQSGRWVIVDAEQTDDLGLPLVRGPFRSLTDAKAEIAEARVAGPAESPLSERLKEAARDRKAASKQRTDDAGDGGKGAGARKKVRAEPEATEPAWLGALESPDRRRARQAIKALEAAGVRDPEGIARRDLVGDVPAIAAAAVASRLATVLTAAEDRDDDPARVAEAVVAALADGHDRDLDVRWRLVDGDGRPIQISDSELKAALDRARKER